MSKTKLSSKLAQVPTSELLSRLVHSSVFTLIGLSLKDAQAATSEADGVESHEYRTDKGRLLVRNDGVRVLIEAWLGEMIILRCALRDRQLDGTNQSSPLTFFPNTDPACNRLPDGFLAAELSIYSWDPATYLDGLDVEDSVGHFIANPDHYVWANYDRDTFFSVWSQAFFLGRAPWQIARPMSNVPVHFVRQSAKLLKEIGYHRIDAVPSWYNVARFFKTLGYQFTYGEHELAYEGIREGLNAFIARQAEEGKKARPLTRSQEAWLVALQNIPAEHIPADLKLPCRWPVTHTNQYWVRMHLELNPYSAGDGGNGKATAKLLKRITDMRDPSHCGDRVVVHTSGYCPCTDQVGASSPAATSPAATGEPEVQDKKA